MPLAESGTEEHVQQILARLVLEAEQQVFQDGNAADQAQILEGPGDAEIGNLVSWGPNERVTFKLALATIRRKKSGYDIE